MTYTVSFKPSKSPKGYHSKRQRSNSLRWLIYVIKSVDNTKLPCYSPTDAAPKFLLKLTPFNPGLGRFTIFYSAICLGRSCHPVNQSHERLNPHSPLPVLRAVCLLLCLVLCTLSGLALLITLVLVVRVSVEFRSARNVLCCLFQLYFLLPV